MLQDLQAECRILTEDKYFTDPSRRGKPKECPLARVIYSSVFPFFAPLSTMDRIDGHQFNGIHNVANFPKKENVGRKGKKIIPTTLIAGSVNVCLYAVLSGFKLLDFWDLRTSFLTSKSTS
jgi:hypothetical protein